MGFNNFDGCPKRYRAEFIEPGIVNYEDEGQGKVFVSGEALSRMCKSFIGKPVVNAAHRDLTFKEAFKLSDEDKESLADGIVYNCGILGTGWGFADMIIWDLETQKNIDQKKHSISCAYIPTEEGPSGKWHNFDYDEEVKNGNYTHMAIVPNPRYERSKVYELPKEYQNSLADGIIETYYKLQKESKKNMAKENKIFKFFMPKKNEGEKKDETKKPEEEAKNNVDEKPADEMINAEDSMIEIDGSQVSLADLIKTYQAEQAEMAAKESTNNVLTPEDEVEVDGKKVLVGELVACYQKKASMKNETSEEDDAAKKIEEEKKASIKNSNFNKIQKAINNAGKEFKVNFVSEDERYAEGKKRYGSKKKEAK